VSQLSAKNITISYPSGKTAIEPVKNLSLDVEKGELLFVIGVNGSGKSTLLRTLAGLQEPASGEVSWKGVPLVKIPINERPLQTAYMFSQYNRVEGMKVLDLVALGRHPYTGRFGKVDESDLAICMEVLKKVGLGDYSQRNTTSLSDGEFKKALLAKLLAQQCPLMILDEPTTHLDLPSELNFLKLLKSESRQSGRTVVLSTHNLQAALKLADRILILGRDSEYSLGTPDEIASGELMCGFLQSNELAIKDGNLIYNVSDD